jgi:GntP family gluconate:H+ symporter
VSDPFFWVLKRVTGDEFSGVVRNYTLPLSAAGLVTLAVALIVEIML